MSKKILFYIGTETAEDEIREFPDTAGAFEIGREFDKWCDFNEMEWQILSDDGKEIKARQNELPSYWKKKFRAYIDAEYSCLTREERLNLAGLTNNDLEELGLIEYCRFE